MTAVCSEAAATDAAAKTKMSPALNVKMGNRLKSLILSFGTHSAGHFQTVRSDLVLRGFSNCALLVLFAAD